MKKIILLTSFLLVSLSFYAQNYKQLISEGTHKVQDVVQLAEQHFDVIGRGKGTGYKSFRRWQYFAERDMDVNGYLKSPKFYQNELERYNSLNAEEGFARRTTVGNWEEMGPTSWNATSGWNPGVGRVTSIAVDATNQNHIIIGSQTGGVWKTMDGGSNWTVLTDNLSNIDVYSLAIDPSNSNTYFWGSTNGSIFKSTDSGATWNTHGNVPNGNINKIIIHPTNSMIMYCSAEWSGVYKSTDGGQSWSSIYFVNNNGYDIEFKPGNPNTVYASGSNFLVSTNGGTTFNNVSGFSNGAKMIGVSAANPNFVYVVEENGGIFGGIYKSTDSGQSFTQLTHTKNYFGYETDGSDTSGQAPRDMDIVVNPNDANDVHIAGINTWRSTDAGATFNITSQWTEGNGIGYCHADVDILQFAGIGTNAKLYVGSDGGIYKADNPTVTGVNYYTDLTQGLGIRQFYKIGVSQTNPVMVVGGAQDNGTSALRTDGNWIDWLGADGMECFVDKTNAQIFYGTSQFGSFYKSVNGGNNLTGITQPDNKGGQNNWNWVVPFEQDPITQDVIYAAFDRVYKSTNGGLNWSSISPNYGSNIDHLKIAPSNNQYMYIAINGTFYYTIDGGANWTGSTLNLGGGSINSIAVHPTDPAKVAIATSNSEKVYISTDSGVNFTSSKFNLPNFSSQAVAWQDNGKDGLYVGMNYGIYYTDTDAGNNWLPFNNGLPNVRINELEVNTADSKLYAATYGRGLWRSDLYVNPLGVDEFELSQFGLYPNPASNEVNLKWNLADNVSVRMFNALGKLVYYAKDASLENGYSINISTYEAGIYFVKLNSQSGEVTKKLIIK